LVFLSNIFKTSNQRLKLTLFFFIKRKFKGKVSELELHMWYFFLNDLQLKTFLNKSLTLEQSILPCSILKIEQKQNLIKNIY